MTCPGFLMPFKPVTPKKISSQIADQIRESILAGEFAPGEKLPPERELIRAFGVSRPSIRDALNLLAAMGLVASHQGGGTVVRSLIDSQQGKALSDLIRTTLDRAIEVIEVRKCLESWAAFYAAQRALPEDLRKMEEVLSLMKDNLIDMQSSEDLDARLHVCIARASHNVIWLHMIQSLFEAMKEFQGGVWRVVYRTKKDYRLLYKHHVAIVVAICDRDADAARQAMLNHLGFAEQRSCDYLANL